MGEENSLLKLWELSGADLESENVATLLKSLSVSKQENRIEDFQSIKFCDNCFASNCEDANWCIECGTAIMKSSVSEYHCSDVVNICQEPRQELTVSDLDNNILVEQQEIPSISTCSDHEGTQTKIDIPKSDERLPLPTKNQYRWFGEDENQVLKYDGSSIQKSKLLQLPNEVLLKILSYLTRDDICKCMLASRRLNVLSKDPSLWKKIKLQKIRNLDGSSLKLIAERCPHFLSMVDCHGHIPVHDIIDFFSIGGKNIEMLHMELTELGTYSTDAFLQSAAKYCSKLHSISLNWISISEKTIQLSTSLKELCVKNKALTFDALQAITTFHRHQFRKLDIESTKIEDVLAAFKHSTMPVLEHFSATFSELSDGKIIHQMMQVFPQMKSLCACGIRHPDEVVKELSKYPLETLHFKQFGRSSRSYFFIRNMATLRNLSIDSIDDEGLSALCQGKLQLISLDLSGSRVTTKCLRGILDGSFLSCLEVLKLNQCDGINDADIERTVQSFSNPCQKESVIQEITKFITNCPSLKLVELRGILCLKKLNHVEISDCIIMS